MYTFRSTSISELPVVHHMQDVAIREQLMTQPLLPIDAFMADATEKIESGERYYFFLEENDLRIGFIEFQRLQSAWSPTIWGKWINTLVYGAGKIAFDVLGFPELKWVVRKTNKRAIRSYERFRFRKTGEASICNVTEMFDFIAVGAVLFYEVTADEFHEREAEMKNNSLPVLFQHLDFQLQTY